MKKSNELKFKALVICIAFIAICFVGCNNDDGPSVPTTKEFAGSQTCQQCHSEIYSIFVESGHPYKLNKVEGKAPTYPWTTLSHLPSGTGGAYTWNDVSWVIGGYGWKARYVDEDGYIVTTDDSQYNYENQSIVGYHSDEDEGTKKYDCGRCHTTGWKSVADGASPKDGLPGMDGDFFAGGVHCEECHGVGNIHAVTEKASDISIDKTAAACGSCHYRNEDHSIAASGGFIKHHEQYDEMISGSHASKECIACHDPHASVKYDSQAKGIGTTTECKDCHDGAKYADANIHNGATCVDCHMGKASKSAIATNDGLNGDLKTHIFDINPAADGNTTFFSADGSKANVDGKGVPLNFICYTCHKNEDGVGGPNSQRSMAQLSAKATGFHD